MWKSFESSVSSAGNLFPLSSALPTCPATESRGMKGLWWQEAVCDHSCLFLGHCWMLFWSVAQVRTGLLSVVSWMSQLSAQFLHRRGS